MQNKCKTDLKQKEILIGDLACEMPFEIPRGIWVSEMIWLAFYSPKSHGMSRENVKIEVILTGLLFIQTPSNMKGKCLILTNFQGGFGLESTNRDFEFGTKSPQFHGHAIGILPL